jgi:hypothetical protein
MVNNSLYLQPVEFTYFFWYYTFRGYGQTIIDLDAIIAELQYRGGIF